MSTIDMIRDPLGAAVSYVTKRRRVSDATTANYGVAGATNVIQRAYVRSRKGRKPNAKRYLLQMAKCGMTRCIQRFHGFKKYEEAGFFPSGYNNYAGTVGSNAQFSYPVHIFDITSCRRSWPDGTLNGGIPLYQLASNSAGDFFWNKVQGQNPNGIGATDFWFLESGRGQDQNNLSPAMGPKSYLEWSDIRLALYGATGQTTKWTVAFIQFNEAEFHPRSTRQSYSPAPSSYGPSDLNKQAVFNNSMECLVKPLVFHPLHSVGSNTPVYRILDSKSMSIQPNSETNEAVAPPNICYKLFKRMNRVCNWKWQLTDNLPVGSATNSVLEPQQAAMDNSGINQHFSGYNQPYVHPNARVYMMIYCTSYLNTSTVSPLPSGYSAPSLVNTPSFDMQVRNKWVYDAT